MAIMDLKNAIIESSGKSRRTIERRARRRKDKFGPFSDEVAIGIIAQEEGLDSAKYFDPSTLAEIRAQLDRIALLREGKKPQVRQIIRERIVVAANPSLSDPILSATVMQDAKEMTRDYAGIYVFENSVREVIRRVLEAKQKVDWWKEMVPKGVQEKAKSRMEKDDRNAWHGRRGGNPINYVDIDDLKSIIQKNWLEFKPIFPDQQWINVRLDEISLSRNVVDHHNPLRKRDETRLRGYLKDWEEQIKAKKGLIP